MNNFNQLRILLAALAFLATGAQFVWGVDEATLFALAVVWLSIPIAFTTFLAARNFFQAPLASMIMLGFWFTQVMLPLLATSLEQKAISYNLERPLEVFLHTGICFLALAATYHFYLKLESSLRGARGFAQRQLKQVLVFEKPEAIHMFALGGVGLLSMFYIYYFRPSAGEENIREAGGFVLKIIQASIVLTNVPFLLLFRRMYGDTRPVRPIVLPLAIYFLAVFAVAIGRNSRSVFMFAILGMVLCYFMGIMLGFYKVRLISVSNVLVGGLAAVIVFGPISDLASAMQIVRGERGETDRTELLFKTFAVLFDRDALRQFRERGGTISRTGWDESYLDNPLLSRFCNLKYASVTLNMYHKLDEGQRREYRKFSIERFWSIFPQPALTALRIRINKKFVTAISWGDYMLYLQTRNPYTLGGKRVTNFFGTGMAAFGWWYVPILCIAMAITFFLFELFVLKKRDPVTGRFKVRFSPLGLLDLAALFMFLPVASVIMIYQLFIRAYWQQILIYAVGLFVARKVLPQKPLPRVHTVGRDQITHKA